MAKKARIATIDLGGRKIDYRIVESRTARKLRARVGIDGLEVIRPVAKRKEDLEAFLDRNQKWILGQLSRLDYIRSVRRRPITQEREILFLGSAIPVIIKVGMGGNGRNKVVFDNNAITILCSPQSRTSPAKSLQNWLRREARSRIETQVQELTEKLGKYPNKIYVRGQKTKLGNCSTSKNLSFNWRLIMAPDFVMQYLIVHEFVHLEVMRHSKQFWLTVQGLCPEMSRAKQWLRTNGHALMSDLAELINENKTRY